MQYLTKCISIALNTTCTMKFAPYYFLLILNIINQSFDKFTNFFLVCVLRPHHIPTLFCTTMYKNWKKDRYHLIRKKIWFEIFENLPKTSWFWFLFSANQCYLINKQMCSVHLIHRSQYIYEIELYIPTDLTKIICSHWRAIRSNSYNLIHNE